MLRRIVPMLPGLLILSVLWDAGCASTPHSAGGAKSRAAQEEPPPPARIDNAYFDDSGPGWSNQIIVNGANFQNGSDPDVAHCQTRQPRHPTPTERRWKNCEKFIQPPSYIQYYVAAVSEHNAGADYIEVRVVGRDGNWTAPKEVARQRSTTRPVR